MKPDPKLDAYEQELENAIGEAFDSGEWTMPTVTEQRKTRAYWQDAVEQTTKRRAITLRLQERDIHRLKVQAHELGMPYQTYIASMLHQVASGKIRGSIDLIPNQVNFLRRRRQ